MYAELYDRARLLPMGYLHIAVDLHQERGKGRRWRDLAFAGDVLLIAAGKDGVGLFGLTGVQKPEPLPRPDEPGDFWGREQEGHRRFRDWCAKRLEYRRLPGVGGEVVRLFAVPGADQVLAVVKDGERHETHLVPCASAPGDPGFTPAGVCRAAGACGPASAS